MRLARPLGAALLLMLSTTMLLATAGTALATGRASVLAAETAGEAIRGTLRDGDGEPVVGAEVAVEQDGALVGTSATGEDGGWQVDVPGPGDYDVVLDESTLPEGVGVRQEGGNRLEGVSIRPGQQRTVIIALGDAGIGSSTLRRVPQLVVNGVKFGLIVAMTAIGLSLIFGTTGLVNFAHGELVTLGAVNAWLFNASAVGPGWHLLLAAPLAIAVTAAIGGSLERGLWRPLRARGTGLIQMLVISIGLSLLLRHVILILFGGRPQPFAQYTLQRATITVGPVSVNPRDVVVIVVSIVVLIGVGLLLERTRIGKAMRAVADNRDLAESSGIDVRRVILFVWVFGGGLAGFGGVLFGAVQTISWDMGFFLLLLMFAGVILGGIGTAYGAMLGSLVVGLVSQLSTLFFPSELQVAWALAVLILVLLVRPQGLLGRAERLG